MFTYNLHLADGSDVGQASYPEQIKVGEELFFGGGRRLRVLDHRVVRRGGPVAVRRATTGRGCLGVRLAAPAPSLPRSEFDTVKKGTGRIHLRPARSIRFPVSIRGRGNHRGSFMVASVPIRP
jgi:hypothetical protein